MKWKILSDPDGGWEICYNTNATDGKSLRESVNPIPKSLPLLIQQLSITMFLSLILQKVLKNRVPKFVSEIVVGILLGPSGIGMKPSMSEIISPYDGVLLLEMFSNLGLVFYMFLVGLEMNITPAFRCGKKVITISIAGWIIPGIFGVFIYWLLEHNSPAYNTRQTYLGFVFWPIALIVTSFPELAQIIANLKLFHTQIGRIALTSALINDAGGWVLLSGALVLNSFFLHKSIGNILKSIALLILIVCVISPTFLWVLRRVAKDEKYNDNHLCFVLMGAIFCGLMSDACGDHSIVGAFLFGFLIPPGQLNSMLKHRLEGYVTKIMMPAFFLSSGLRANVFIMVRYTRWLSVVLVVFVASMAKILSTILAFKLCNMSIQKGLALGVLLNTKGVLVLIIMNTALTIKAIGVESFTVMLLAILLMTCMVQPLVSFTYKPLRKFKQYKDRTIQASRPQTEFRILLCIHSIRNVSGLLNLLEVSNATSESPIAVFPLQLIELTGRDSALQIIQDNIKPESNNSGSESEQKFSVFTKYQQQRNSVIVQLLATASPYSSMHLDIITLAEEKRSHIIILPFQMPKTSGSLIRGVNAKITTMNHNVMEKAPCSVGIFVDHGQSFTDEETSYYGFRHVAMFFLGGPDDREALAYAWRMCDHQSVELTVVRFISSSDSSYKDPTNINDYDNGKLLKSMIDKEKHDDNDYILEFRRSTRNNQSVDFIEKRVLNGDETLRAIQEMSENYELFIVGRGKGVTTNLISGMSSWIDCSELGFLGETLATADFAMHISVLVVQQYCT